MSCHTEKAGTKMWQRPRVCRSIMQTTSPCNSSQSSQQFFALCASWHARAECGRSVWRAGWLSIVATSLCGS
jgi:hypothetical protein